MKPPKSQNPTPDMSGLFAELDALSVNPACLRQFVDEQEKTLNCFLSQNPASLN